MMEKEEVPTVKKQILDGENASPLYKQLMKKLRGDISAGLYPIHSRIPSEQELCDSYGVSRVTVRKALAELTQEGLLARRQGKGTFVATPRIRKDLRDVNSFHDACRLMGMSAATRVIRAGLVNATEDDCQRLLCTPEDQVVEIVRVRLADDMPVMRETNHFPAAYTWLLEENLTGSLYGILRAHGVEADSAIHEVSLGYADPGDAHSLDVNAGDALLCLNETIFDQNGSPLHTSVQRIRGDRFTFRI